MTWCRWGVLLLFVFGVAANVSSQTQSAAHTLLLATCEPGGCTRWEFYDGHAKVTWANGEAADLEIEQFPFSPAGNIKVHRIDSAGPAKGMDATYIGTRSGPIIEGTVSWTWPGHPEGRADWFGVVMADDVHMEAATASKPAPIPPSLNVCEDGHGCVTWSFNGSVGVIPGLANLTVERFDDLIVSVRRNETAGALKGMEALYVGIRKGNEIHGLAAWKWSGEPHVGAIGWHAILPTATPNPPSVAENHTSHTPPPILSIEKLVDVEVPDKIANLPLPPPAPWQPKKTVAAFDLNGVWEREGMPAGQVEKITIFQLRDHVVARTLEGQPKFTPHSILFLAQYTKPGTASGPLRNEDFGNNGTIQDMFDSSITISDADHLQVSLLLESKHVTDWRYHRTARNAVEDFACESSNPRHVSGESALARGDIYLLEKDFPSANCWFYLGAAAGNGDAQTEYGKSIHDGRGIPQNPALGIALIQQAAMQASERSYPYMSALFGTGNGMPHSKQRRNYWMGRQLGTSPDVVHDGQRNPLRPWMSQTAQPCESSNSRHVGGGDALDMGRVAFEARSLQLAHCWFRIGAEQGNVKSWTYLGLMSAFGLGVETNLKNAFSYMYHAAHDKDPFATVYLANFYRYGIGVEPDDGEARRVMDVAWRLPDGESAFERVEGTYKSPMEALGMMGGIFMSAVTAESECPSSAGHYEMRGQARVWVEGGRAVGCKTPTADAILSQVDADKHPTLASPEEVYPEIPFKDF